MPPCGPTSRNRGPENRNQALFTFQRHRRQRLEIGVAGGGLARSAATENVVRTLLHQARCQIHHVSYDRVLTAKGVTHHTAESGSGCHADRVMHAQVVQLFADFQRGQHTPGRVVFMRHGGQPQYRNHGCALVVHTQLIERTFVTRHHALQNQGGQLRTFQRGFVCQAGEVDKDYCDAPQFADPVAAALAKIGDQRGGGKIPQRGGVSPGRGPATGLRRRRGFAHRFQHCHPALAVAAGNAVPQKFRHFPRQHHLSRQSQMNGRSQLSQHRSGGHRLPAVVHAAGDHYRNRTCAHRNANPQSKVPRGGHFPERLLRRQSTLGSSARNLAQPPFAGRPKRQQRIAGEFEYVAPVLVDGVDQCAELPVQNAGKLFDSRSALARQILGQCREPGDIGEDGSRLQWIGARFGQRARVGFEVSCQHLRHQSEQKAIHRLLVYSRKVTLWNVTLPVTPLSENPQFRIQPSHFKTNIVPAGCRFPVSEGLIFPRSC